MKLITGILALTTSLALIGCYSTIDGHVRPGVPFVKDDIESSYERSPDQILGAAREVLKFNGTLEGENTINKTLWGKVDTRTVRILVIEVDPKITRVVVQARNRGRADIELASEIDKQIALRLVRP